jgi:transposase-like protein
MAKGSSSHEFRLEAVRLVEERGMTVTQTPH